MMIKIPRDYKIFDFLKAYKWIERLQTRTVGPWLSGLIEILENLESTWNLKILQKPGKTRIHKKQVGKTHEI